MVHLTNGVDMIVWIGTLIPSHYTKKLTPINAKVISGSSMKRTVLNWTIVNRIVLSLVLIDRDFRYKLKRKHLHSMYPNSLLYILVFSSTNRITLNGLLVLIFKKHIVLKIKNILLTKRAGQYYSKKSLWILMTNQKNSYLKAIFFHDCILMVLVSHHWNIHILVSGFPKKFI